MKDLTQLLPLGDLLTVIVVSLLVFISISVSYLSFIEWKDKKRLKKFTIANKK